MTESIVVATTAYDLIINAMIAAVPHEGCGYGMGNLGRIDHFIPIRNIADSAKAFTFDPAEQCDAIRMARSRGLIITAVVHSHPGGSAKLSAEDCDFADPEQVQVVVALCGESLEIAAFRVVEGKAVPVAVVIESE